MDAEEKEDRISKLSDILLHEIMSFLDATDVKNLRVLSKRWRYLWLTLPYLNFNSRNYLPSPPYSYERNRMGFVNLVDDFVLYRRRNSTPIVKFSLNSSYYIEAPIVESWIQFAIQLQVQQLEIMPYSFFHRAIQLPQWFHGCKSLTTLELGGFNDNVYFHGFGGNSIELPNSFDLPFLKCLRLRDFVDFDGSILSTCPNLDILRLANVRSNFRICGLNLKVLVIVMQWDYGSDLTVTIMVPKLIKFKYYGPIRFLFSVENLDSLEQAEITVTNSLPTVCLWDQERQNSATKLLNLVNQFHNARSITLSLNTFKHLTREPLFLNWPDPSPFSNLKYLNLTTSVWPKTITIPGFILNYFLGSEGALQFRMSGY